MGRSPASRGCGSKHRVSQALAEGRTSPASRGCGSKHQALADDASRRLSPASRGCGSKPTLPKTRKTGLVSRFTRVRIETIEVFDFWTRKKVSRFTRVRIETSTTLFFPSRERVSRFTRVRIETPIASCAMRQIRSPASRGCGSKPDRTCEIRAAGRVSRFTRVRIET